MCLALVRNRLKLRDWAVLVRLLCDVSGCRDCCGSWPRWEACLWRLRAELGGLAIVAHPPRSVVAYANLLESLFPTLGLKTCSTVHGDEETWLMCGVGRV
jgi:hypothetical protein